MSVVEPVSRETHKVGHGPLKSNYATDINEYTLEGNNKMINAHILLPLLWAHGAICGRWSSYSIKDGSEIRFWEDKCLGNASLCE
jgi:hypothetical protein